MTVMTELRTSGTVHSEFKIIRSIWKRTLSFRKKKAEKTEDRFAGYKGVRDITIKKGPSGLGIMIIEGRHTEAGRGIFVSDLQEGSAAEQAGLQIGDMILAVNRDSLLRCSYDAAAAKLKHTEGVVVLTVCTPNLKDDNDTATTPASGGSATSRPASRNQTPDPGLGAGASRPQTPRPAPSPVKVEPPPDPATAQIVPNQETVIEVNTNNETLGIVLLGGCDTFINGPAAVLLDVFAKGAIGKDKRLKPGDQIRHANGIAITEQMTAERIGMSIKQWHPKMKMTVYRPEPHPFDILDIELARKPSKNLGISFKPFESNEGVYIQEILAGSAADLDGRLQKGDILISCDGKDLSKVGWLDAAVVLKLIGLRTQLKFKRYKVVR